MSSNKTLKFEEAMKELEIIVKKLEDNQVELDAAINLYKEGLELSKWCEARLNDAEKQITEILTREGEQPFLESDEE